MVDACDNKEIFPHTALARSAGVDASITGSGAGLTLVAHAGRGGGGAGAGSGMHEVNQPRCLSAKATKEVVHENTRHAGRVPRSLKS